MKKSKWILVGMAMVAALVLGAACGSEVKETPETEANTGTPDTSGALGALTIPEIEALASSLAPTLRQGGLSQEAGIWVTGQGKVTIEPDLALLSLGVESRADTVEAARAEAAAAMTNIIDVLRARNIAENDIQTRFFNISPEYTYQEVFENGLRYNKQVLTGYRVTNNVIAKVRDLDILGVTIDEVVQAGGDATRIQSIQFAAEDPSIAQTQAREKAVMDAMAKAEQFATLTGVTRGNLVFITESGGGIPVARDFAFNEAIAAAPAVTSINVGELVIQVNIQALFAIEIP